MTKLRMKYRTAIALLGAVLSLGLLAEPARALDEDKQAVLDSFKTLMASDIDRLFFGLPPKHFWRPSGPISVGLYSPRVEAETPLYERLMSDFNALCETQFDLIVATDPTDPNQASIQVFPNLRVKVGPRQQMANEARDLFGNQVLFQRFEDGRWPFLFHFPRDGADLGQVWVADDERPEVAEAALILSLIWAQGGVTLGNELVGLVTHDQDGPIFTQKGAEVFGLFCNPKIESGSTLDRAFIRAHKILETDE